MSVRAATLMLAALASAACDQPRFWATSDESERGLLLLREFGCVSCHVIPGVAAAMGHAAPSLERIGSRVYLAGILPNTPANMVRWIRTPQAFDPLTAMPDLGVSESQARDMAAYLHRLR